MSGGSSETLAASVLDAVALQGILAHRFPFLLVDRVHVIEPGKHVRGLKRVTAGEWWFDAPGPVTWDGSLGMPHTMVLEALAQTSGALIADLVDRTQQNVAYFMGLERVRLRELAHVGDLLVMDVTLRQWRRGICRAHGVASVGRRLVATADVTTIVRTMRPPAAGA